MNVMVTGGTGMVGKAIQKLRPNWIYLSSKECNLYEKDAFQWQITRYNPTHVIHLAARVGGVKGNTEFVGDFCMDNQVINNNVLLPCVLEPRIKKVVSLLSTCVYPNKNYVKYPLTEDQLHNGPPHYSNFGYAYAKRMIEIQSRAYNVQYGKNKFSCAIPNNIYGNHDNFDLENGHVIPAIIRKVYEAKQTGSPPAFWGNGTALREFTHSSDIARALIYMIETDAPNLMNIGTTEQLSIQSVVSGICDALEYTGTIEWDTSAPAGQYRKPSSNAKFLKENPSFTYTPFEEGIKEVCKWYKATYPNVRGF